MQRPTVSPPRNQVIQRLTGLGESRGLRRASGVIVRAMFEPPVSMQDAFVIRVHVKDIKPPVWRRLRIPARATLGALHRILQVAFGWTDTHLHDFRLGELTFGPIDPEDDRFCVDENAAPFGAVARQGSRLLYRYDFGDGWEHEILVENVERGDGHDIECLDGARACPPEDSGGPYGYADMLKVLGKPRHAEHARLKEWVGPAFDPERFDRKSVDAELRTLFKAARRPRRSDSRR
jgi:hypothetical protein